MLENKKVTSKGLYTTREWDQTLIVEKVLGLVIFCCAQQEKTPTATGLSKSPANLIFL
jgi:hypothetical protein